MLGDGLSLDPVERDCLAVIVRVECGELFSSFLDILTEYSGKSTDEALALMTGHPTAAVRQRLSSRGRLIAIGLVLSAERSRRHGWNDGYSLSKRLRVGFDERMRSVEDLLERFFDTPPTPETLWSEFNHVAESKDQIVRLIRVALAHGINTPLFRKGST